MTTQEQIGKKLSAEAQRDAIHIAVLPVVADDDWIAPGETVRLAEGTNNLVRRAQGGPSIGIADPFLNEPIRKQDRFWVFIHPNTVTGMRHEWEHPQIDHSKPATNESEAWLQQFALEWSLDYDELIAEASAKSAHSGDHYVTAQGIDLHGAQELGSDHDLFWSHLQNLTGKQFDLQHRNNFGWSCTC
jgi:hypothetical protein